MPPRERNTEAHLGEGSNFSIPPIGDAEIRPFPQVSFGISFSRRHPLPTSSNGGVERRPGADLRGAHVLVVEDHWPVANALRLFLESEGMEVSGPAATTA